MECGDHQVAGQSRADGEIRRFVVADFADDQHLRILPQQVSSSAGEIEAARLIHLRLHDARNNLFDRIFHGDDVAPPDSAR